MLLKCAHYGDETAGQWPARLVFDLAAAEAGLSGPEPMEAERDKPETPAPTPEITLAAVKAETDELMKTIEGSGLPGDVRGEFKTDVDALLKELAAMGEGATAEMLTDAHGELVAIQTDLDGVLNPYVALEGVVAGEEAGGFANEILIQKGDNVSQLLVAHVAGKEAPDHAKVADHYGIDPNLEGQAFVQALFRLPDAQRADFFFNLVHPGNEIVVGSDGRLQVVQGESPDRPGVPEGKTRPVTPKEQAPVDPGAEGATPEAPTPPAPKDGDPDPEEQPPTPDEVAPPPDAPDAAANADPESSETPGLNEANTLVSIEKSLDQPPGAVEFTYYSEQGELQFQMANGRVQVTYPDGQMATYAIYRRVDNSSTRDGPMLPPSTPATFYVARQPKGPQGYFSKNAAEQGTWYHGFERNRATSGAIGMTPEAILQMATQIATGQVAPGQDGQLPTSEKRITPDRARMQRGEDHLTIQQVSDGPAGYQLSQEISQGEGKPLLRLYTSPTNAGAVLIRVGREQAEIKSVRDTAGGIRVIRYQLPGQPVQTVKVEAPTENVSGKMKGYLEQHAARPDPESPLIVQDETEKVLARVVQVGPSKFYQDGEGPWRVVTQDGKRASLYSEADPLAMNQLETQLTALGAKYEERSDFRIGVGGVLFVPDASTATPTEVTYRGALPDGRRLVLTVSGAPEVKDMPYTLMEVNAAGEVLQKHYYGSKALLEAEFNAFIEAEAAPRPVEVATAEAVQAPEVAAAPRPVTAEAAQTPETDPEATLEALETMETSVLSTIAPLLETSDSTPSNPDEIIVKMFMTGADSLEAYLANHELPPNFEQHLSAMVASLRQVGRQFEKASVARARLSTEQKARLDAHLDGKVKTINAELETLLGQLLTTPEAMDSHLDSYLDTFGHLFDNLKADPELGEVATETDLFFDQFVALGDQWMDYSSMKIALEYPNT